MFCQPLCKPYYRDYNDSMNKLKQWLFPEPVSILFPKDLPPDQREANRVIRFVESHNFRDLGGYVGENGRLTKWGVLYRADNLHRLSSKQFDLFNQLKLHTIIDFRSRFEKEKEPNNLPNKINYTVYDIPILDRANNQMGKTLHDKIRTGDLKGLNGVELMLDANRQFATEYTPEYRRFVQHILAAKGQPVLFHCTGGKDRTGFASAILLKLLGVSEDAILQDYLLSNELIMPALKRQLKIYAALRGPKALQVVEELARVEAGYLGAAFEMIDTTYGNFEAYVEGGLQLSADEVAALKTFLLD